MNLNISEIFYSLQGEGARAGTANIFIRLQGCQTKNACFASGVNCDTEFESGRGWAITELKTYIAQFNCPYIIWTGGEPAQQLTKEIVEFFKPEYYQAIETSGLFSVPDNLDFVCVSPKVAEHIIKKNFPQKIDELKYIRHVGQDIPQPAAAADYYYISPHSDGFSINAENLRHCIELVKLNPRWRLSIQQHKLWKVL